MKKRFFFFFVNVVPSTSVWIFPVRAEDVIFQKNMIQDESASHSCHEQAALLPRSSCDWTVPLTFFPLLSVMLSTFQRPFTHTSSPRPLPFLLFTLSPMLPPLPACLWSSVDSALGSPLVMHGGNASAHMTNLQLWEAEEWLNKNTGHRYVAKNAAATPRASTITLLCFEKSSSCPRELRG